ncbi:phosphoglycerate mutase (2,3-diphosphoglycerate-independent), partial [bacterium]|nr:phosphoglycerate mutase (2,3-diphosphoglycerate-independent) [bacterium]
HLQGFISAIKKAYKKGFLDEFMKPIILTDEKGKPVGRIKKGDPVIFLNFRKDRARELTGAFTDPEFEKFTTKDLGLNFVTMTQYEKGLVPGEQIAFLPVYTENTFGEVVSDADGRQVRIAETEKYAHVTFFFDGGVEKIFPGEERILIDSPDVATYDLKPEMSAGEITDKLVDRIKEHEDNVIICNYANADMVGHTGNFEATQKAVEKVDQCVERVVKEARAKGFNVIITADHGNAEQMMADRTTNEPHTAHTTNPVPFIFIPAEEEKLGDLSVKDGGRLADVAPTMLEVLNIEKPEEMTGTSLLEGWSISEETSKKVLLVILDGWGINPDRNDPFDAIRTADTSVMDSLTQKYPSTQLAAHGVDVGIPDGIMGNSDVGHSNLGAGRILYQDILRINNAIADGSFYSNEALLGVVQNAKEKNQALHLMGLVSNGQVHSSMNHIYACLELAKREGLEEVYIHAFLDGRDTPPKSAEVWLTQLQEKIDEIGVGKIVDATGRYYAMDRD